MDSSEPVTADGAHSYTYDAENRIQSVDGGSTTYVYNAAGMRVRKTTGGVSVDYLYDLAGNVVTELNTSGAWTRKEVYAGSRHVATYKDGIAGQTYFSHPDWLGTERARTDKNGAVTETCTNLPFGDAQACTGPSVSPLHFTGKQRDTETDNDYFGARYYVSRQGRWLTPDWSSRGEAVPYASLTNPQTLNLYAYVGNNPVTATDPDGHLQPMMVGRGPGNEAIAGPTGSIFGDALFLPGGGISIGLASSPALASSGTLTSTRAAANALMNALADPQQQTSSVPDGLTVAKVEVLSDCKGCSGYGIKVAVTYQLTASGKPVNAEGYVMQEKVSGDIKVGDTWYRMSFPTGWIDIGPTAANGNQRTTDSKGQFKDAPVGMTWPTSFTHHATQEIRAVDGAGKAITFGKNKVTVTSDRAGHGRIHIVNKKMGIDVSVER